MAKLNEAPVADSMPATMAAEQSFPLVALLQLATFWAALVACIDGNRLRTVLNHPPDELILLAALAAVAVVMGGSIGAFLGLGQVRMWRSAAAGFVAGAVCGVAILAVYLAPASIERGVGASIILVLTTLGFRWRTP